MTAQLLDATCDIRAHCSKSVTLAGALLRSSRSSRSNLEIVELKPWTEFNTAPDGDKYGGKRSIEDDEMEAAHED
jgi:hypothetical protein